MDWHPTKQNLVLLSKTNVFESQQLNRVNFTLPHFQPQGSLKSEWILNFVEIKTVIIKQIVIYKRVEWVIMSAFDIWYFLINFVLLNIMKPKSPESRVAAWYQIQIRSNCILMIYLLSKHWENYVKYSLTENPGRIIKFESHKHLKGSEKE